MNAQYFIEVLARNGEVKHRHRLQALPISIGRGYDNDFILDDPLTSPHHAVIECTEGGDLEVRDLGSRNGMMHNGRRQDRLTVDGNTIFQLGHTHLRVRSTDFPVIDEATDTTLHNWEGWPPALAGLLLLTLLTFVAVWSSDIEISGTIHYLTSLAGMLGFTLLWCGIWSLANRLFEGQMRFGRHLFVVACGLIMIETVSLLSSIFAYAFSLEALTRYGNHIVIAIVAGVVYFHLLTINSNHTKRFALISVFLSVLGSGVTLMVNYQANGRLTDELYMGELLPPKLRFSSDMPVAQFLDGVTQLKAGVDEDRTKEVRLEGEDGEH